jgi:hypothetical protein
MAELLASTTFTIPTRKTAPPITPFAPHALDLSPLAEQRAAHETDSAIKGLRNRSASKIEPASLSGDQAEGVPLASAVPEAEQRQRLAGQLVHQFNALLRENDAEPIAPGLIRQVRWTGSVSGRYTTAGNAANAELAAGARASAVCVSLLPVAIAISSLTALYSRCLSSAESC